MTGCKGRSEELLCLKKHLSSIFWSFEGNCLISLFQYLVHIAFYILCVCRGQGGMEKHALTK